MNQVRDFHCAQNSPPAFAEYNLQGKGQDKIRKDFT